MGTIMDDISQTKHIKLKSLIAFQSLGIEGVFFSL